MKGATINCTRTAATLHATLFATFVAVSLITATLLLSNLVSATEGGDSETGNVAAGNGAENGAEAQQHYISDIFYVPLRSGASNKHRIVHKGIKSGAALTLLEVDDESGYSRIRTKGGVEGWLPHQYLSPLPVARQRIDESLQRQQQFQRQLQQAEKQRDQLRGQQQQTEKQLGLLSQKNQQLSGELARIKKISANATALDTNHRALLKENELLQIEIAELQADNARLSEKSDKEWFLRGSFAVLIGALLAALLPRLKTQQRRDGWR